MTEYGFILLGSLPSKNRPFLQNEAALSLKRDLGPREGSGSTLKAAVTKQKHSRVGLVSTNVVEITYVPRVSTGNCSSCSSVALVHPHHTS